MTVGPQAKMIATAAMTMYEDKLHPWSSLCICKRMKSATTDTTIPALGLTPCYRHASSDQPLRAWCLHSFTDKRIVPMPTAIACTCIWSDYNRCSPAWKSKRQTLGHSIRRYERWHVPRICHHRCQVLCTIHRGQPQAHTGCCIVPWYPNKMCRHLTLSVSLNSPTNAYHHRYIGMIHPFPLQS